MNGNAMRLTSGEKRMLLVVVVVVVVVCPCLALTIFVSCLLCKHKQPHAFDMPVAKRAANQTTKSSTTLAITVATRATGRQMFSGFESFSSRFSSSSSHSPALNLSPEVHPHNALVYTSYIYDAAFVLCLLCDCCVFSFSSPFLLLFLISLFYSVNCRCY